MNIPKNVFLKIKYIKQLLKMSFHAFNREDDLWVFWIENKKGEHLNWTSKTIMGTIEEALEYVKHEIQMGVIKDIDDPKDK